MGFVKRFHVRAYRKIAPRKMEAGVPSGPKVCAPFKFYEPELLRKIECFYVVAIVLWIVVVIYFRLVEDDAVSIIILFIPIAVYMLGLWSLSEVTIDDEEKILSSSYLSIGILVIVPLLTWTHDRFGEETKILQIIVLAIILAVTSLIDVWTPAKNISLVRHFRSILQVAALTLIIYVLYHIFLKRSNHLNPKHEKIIGGVDSDESNTGTSLISSNIAATAAAAHAATFPVHAAVLPVHAAVFPVH